MISDVFIRRPILATVCSLVIILAGAIAIPQLPIARYPELTPPSVAVAAFYTGANAQAVESAVTTPLDEDSDAWLPAHDCRPACARRADSTRGDVRHQDRLLCGECARLVPVSAKEVQGPFGFRGRDRTAES